VAEADSTFVANDEGSAVGAMQVWFDRGGGGRHSIAERAADVSVLHAPSSSTRPAGHGRFCAGLVR